MLKVLVRPFRRATVRTQPDPALLQQLKIGGRLLVPVGPEGEQQLIRFTRKEQRIEKESLGPVAFVPLLGGMA